MTADLKVIPGRVFVGNVMGRPQMVTVKSVRRNRKGTRPTSCVLTYESDQIEAELRVTLGESGELTGFRRVTLAQVGTARHLANLVGSQIPTDSVVIVTRDRVGSGEIFGKGI
jgi:hypothetical protein